MPKKGTPNQGEFRHGTKAEPNFRISSGVERRSNRPIGGARRVPRLYTGGGRIKVGQKMDAGAELGCRFTEPTAAGLVAGAGRRAVAVKRHCET
jgi:hypothetical protein